MIITRNRCCMPSNLSIRTYCGCLVLLDAAQATPHDVVRDDSGLPYYVGEAVKSLASQ